MTISTKWPPRPTFAEELTEPKSITEDFKLLTSNDQMKHRIKDEVNRLADKIKEKLMSEVSNITSTNYFIESDIPVAFHGPVEKELKAWAKLQGWGLKYDKGKISSGRVGFYNR